MLCQRILKIFLFVVNLIFSLVGIGIFVIGILGVIYVKKINDNISQSASVPPFGTMLMAIGAIVFFISFCGCFGAIKEINCLLIAFSVIMFLLMVIKVAIAAFLLVNKISAVEEQQKILSMFPRTNDMKLSIPPEIHGLEFMAKCCGVSGPDSYTSIGAPIPLSCCPIQFGKKCDTNNENLYSEGCKDSHQIERYIDIAAYTFLGIALFELASMVSALYLVCYSRKTGGYYEYD